MIEWTGQIASPDINESTEKGYLEIAIDWKGDRGPIVISPELFEQLINTVNWVNANVQIENKEPDSNEELA